MSAKLQEWTWQARIREKGLGKRVKGQTERKQREEEEYVSARRNSPDDKSQKVSHGVRSPYYIR